MPTSKKSNDPIKSAATERFRTNVRHANACPTCGAPKEYFCKSEVTGGRRNANHKARVELLVGYSLNEVRWRAQADRAKKKRAARAARPAQEYVEYAG